MASMRFGTCTLLIAALMAGAAAGVAFAQSKGSGKIICWKDRSGKVVGCGDRVPPEYQDAATQQLDRQGIVRKSTLSVEDQAKQEAEREAKAKETEKKRLEERRLADERRRQDIALINTFANEKEIDVKRDRDLAVLDGQLTQMRLAQKNAADNLLHVRERHDAQAKGKDGATDAMKEELARAEDAAARAAEHVSFKEKEMDELRKRYAEMRARFVELRGGPSSPKK